MLNTIFGLGTLFCVITLFDEMIAKFCSGNLLCGFGYLALAAYGVFLFICIMRE